MTATHRTVFIKRHWCIEHFGGDHAQHCHARKYIVCHCLKSTVKLAILLGCRDSGGWKCCAAGQLVQKTATRCDTSSVQYPTALSDYHVAHWRAKFPHTHCASLEVSGQGNLLQRSCDSCLGPTIA